MSLKYEILKRLVKMIGLKRRWTGMSTEELLASRRKENAKNKIPDLKDDELDISRVEVMGCPVLKLIRKQKTDCANLFIIGGGMVYFVALPYAKKIYLTEVEAEDEKADSYFPEFDKTKYNREVIKEGKNDDLAYTFVKYTKK